MCVYMSAHVYVCVCVCVSILKFKEIPLFLQIWTWKTALIYASD